MSNRARVFPAEIAAEAFAKPLRIAQVRMGEPDASTVQFVRIIAVVLPPPPIGINARRPFRPEALRGWATMTRPGWT